MQLPMASGEFSKERERENQLSIASCGPSLLPYNSSVKPTRLVASTRTYRI